MPKRSTSKSKVRPKTAKPGFRRFLLAVSLVAAISILSGFFMIRKQGEVYDDREEILKNLSRLDLTEMERPVTEKIRRLQKNLQNHPDSADAWGRLAMNLDAADLKTEAIAAYQQAANLDETDFRWPYFCAISLSQTGSEECLQWFERAYRIRPDYAPLSIQYGNAFFYRGKLDESEKLYQLAIQNDPAAAHAYYGLAQIYITKTDLETARQNLQKAFESNPSYGEAYHLLATVCRRMNDVNCSLRAAAAAKDLPKKTSLPDPVYMQVAREGESSLWHRARGSEYMKQKSYEAAISEFQKAMEIRSDVQTREDLAQALNAGGKPARALTEYELILREHPTARNYFGAGLAHAKKGSFEQAEDYFKKSIELDPEFSEAYLNLAVAYAKQGRIQETIKVLRNAIQVKPDYLEAHYHLALAYLQTENEKGALSQYEIIKKLNVNAARQLETILKRSKTE